MSRVQCYELEEVMRTIEDECSIALSSAEDQADMLHTIKQARDDIISWKAHELHSVHQAEAKHSVLAKLDSPSVLLVQDWAIKYMPRKYREAQSDWFAKRGLPWHISVAIRRSQGSEHFESQTLVHVFQSCAQDGVTVASIMLDCLTTLKKEIPDLEMAYYKQDNAGCYHSGNSIISAKLADDAVGVAVLRNDFSDPQGGKGICDRKAATIKGDIGRYVNEGYDVINALQLKTAIESGQGTTGVNASYVAAKLSSTFNINWDGISLLNNFEYDETGVRVWRAFNVGFGKEVPWAKFEGVMEQPEKLEILEPPSQNVSSAPPFKIVRHRHIKKSSVRADFSTENENQDQSSIGQNKPDDMLFPCPEDGCVKAYSRFANLQTHLDTGKHQMMLEQETLYDRAKREYSSKLTEGCSRIPSIQVTVQAKSDALPPLPMGWALKKQSEFLTDQFQKGEQSGRKSDPQEVSKAMSLARDQAGERQFQPDEVLTSQQISGFFSRLSAKKQLEVTTDGNKAKASEVSEVAMESADKDEISTEAESHLCAV
ncbi:uncharacterized protein LOC110051794 isoform X2 [Orbicella faveolata]|uniref:uncharacterized protein LOC110051794 isoform X1 n=1 Tax=Orbicella faveolata TaxID=48498 RepID=UPI0009E3D311|nr:uncharacterized protein LOC110051794 isoform X1 [Orbicella faveolata]XP_020613530.1 uncharacterized protein LOC110051794 isoform X2 [Orbicella faveolata]